MHTENKCDGPKKYIFASSFDKSTLDPPRQKNCFRVTKFQSVRIRNVYIAGNLTILINISQNIENAIENKMVKRQVPK